MVRCLLGGVQDDTVGRRYRRAEIERGEADAIQENGDPEGGSTAPIERGEAEASLSWKVRIVRLVVTHTYTHTDTDTTTFLKIEKVQTFILYYV